jgi:hypothetical protein
MESRRDDAINFHAADILLFHGENPLDEYEGRNAWRDAFSWIIDDSLTIKASSTLQILTLIWKMVDSAIDLSKRRAMLYEGRTPAGAIRTFILGATCCSDARIERCACPTAQNLEIIANSILRILESRNETLHTNSRYRDRSRRPQSRGRKPLLDKAARMPLGPLTHKHDRSVSKSYNRSTSIQSMFRSTHHNADHPQLSRDDWASPAKRLDTSETASAGRGVSNGTDTYRASEPYARSSKAPARKNSGPRAPSTRINGVSGNLHSMAPPGRSSSAYPAMQDRRTPARHRDSHGSKHPVRPSVGNYSELSSLLARSQANSSDLHPSDLGGSRPPRRKRSRKRSIWHRLKQLFSSRS